jgi:hypothetical protein
MMKQWELFEKIPAGRTARSMRVSLNQRGIFSLNKKVFAELDQPEAVELYFDKINKLIGIKPSKLDSKYSYPVKQAGAANSWVVRASAFLTYYNIKITGTMMFPSPTMEDGMVVLDMASAVPSSRKKEDEAKPQQQAFTLGSRN